MRAHPVHMMIVHFPAALLPMDLIFSGAGIYLGTDKLSIAGYYCLLAGVAAGWLAILTGLFDLFKHVLRRDGGGTQPALIHGGLQFLMVLGFTFLLSAEYHHTQLIHDPPAWLWGVKSLLIIILGIGNYFGGELVLRYVAKEFKH